MLLDAGEQLVVRHLEAGRLRPELLDRGEVDGRLADRHVPGAGAPSRPASRARSRNLMYSHAAACFSGADLFDDVQRRAADEHAALAGRARHRCRRRARRSGTGRDPSTLRRSCRATPTCRSSSPRCRCRCASRLSKLPSGSSGVDREPGVDHVRHPREDLDAGRVVERRSPWRAPCRPLPLFTYGLPAFASHCSRYHGSSLMPSSRTS